MCLCGGHGCPCQAQAQRNGGDWRRMETEWREPCGWAQWPRAIHRSQSRELDPTAEEEVVSLEDFFICSNTTAVF